MAIVTSSHPQTETIRTMAPPKNVRPADARRMFSEAMDLAARQGETHMRDFLQGQLDALPPEP